MIYKFINVFHLHLLQFCEVFDTYSCFMKTEPTVHVAWNGQGANG